MIRPVLWPAASGDDTDWNGMQTRVWTVLVPAAHPQFERQWTHVQPVGSRYIQGWHFDARAFDDVRDHIERSSQRRWTYSGETDLVLVNGWLIPHEELIIDWPSTMSWQLPASE